jgi:hypothetical protein
MRVLLDTNVMVRATGKASGPARNPAAADNFVLDD